METSTNLHKHQSKISSIFLNLLLLHYLLLWLVLKRYSSYPSYCVLLLSLFNELNNYLKALLQHSKVSESLKKIIQSCIVTENKELGRESSLKRGGIVKANKEIKRKFQSSYFDNQITMQMRFVRKEANITLVSSLQVLPNS